MLIIHHNDFDGMASAGIFANFIDFTGLESSEISFEAIDYNHINDYYARDLYNSSCVLDFPFNPTAKWWFDHHKTSFKDNTYQKMYKKSPYRYWNTRCKSCPTLLSSFFKKFYPKYFLKMDVTYRELIKNSSMIDSALYKSPRQVYDFNNPFILFNHALNHCYSDVLVRKFIDSVRSAELKSLFNSNDFQNIRDDLNCTFEKYNDFFKTKIKPGQKVIELNFLEAGLRGDRYLGYLYNPDADYTITIDKRGYNYYIGVGYNPWKIGNLTNVGSLLKKFGGGGRMNVGAALFNSIDDLNNALSTIRKLLQA